MQLRFTQNQYEIDDQLKEDHVNRPIIIIKIKVNIEKKDQYQDKPSQSRHSSKYEIILERFHSEAKKAEEFLIQIAEPSSITQNIQTFQITFYSLYTAMALQLKEEKIIQNLYKYAKNQKIPEDVKNFIHHHTKYYNRASLYFDNSDPQDGFYKLEIEKSLCSDLFAKEDSKFFEENLEYLEEKYDDQLKNQNDIHDVPQLQLLENGDDTMNQKRNFMNIETIYKVFRVKTNNHFTVNQRLVEKYNIPVSQKYNYHEKERIKQSKGQYEHKPNVKLFEHQKRALQKIFKDNVARSGVVILPCGAGKTLLGISVIIKIKQEKNLIICDSVIGSNQWHDQFIAYTLVDKSQLIQILAGKEVPEQKLKDPNIIVIITQDMLQSKVRKDVQFIKSMVWNVCIMDEVHGLPAQQINEAFGQLRTHFKIGLTATPYRQDDKIKEIFYKVGPKLHESMIVDLTSLGFVSKIYCIQVQVGMNDLYRQRYQQMSIGNNQQVMNSLYQLNPKKYEVLQYLLDLHRQRKDKIIIFQEKIKLLAQTGTLQKFAELNRCPIILQDVDQRERQAIFKMFREDKIDVIIFGNIADQTLDLPSANVGIQMSFNYSSVRQEFQRMGRIQRKKENISGEHDCFFYTVVTQGTREVTIQIERQISVINQGYPYEVISSLDMNLEKDTKKEKLREILQEMEEKILSMNSDTLNKQYQDDE